MSGDLNNLAPRLNTRWMGLGKLQGTLGRWLSLSALSTVEFVFFAWPFPKGKQPLVMSYSPVT